MFYKIGMFTVAVILAASSPAYAVHDYIGETSPVKLMSLHNEKYINSENENSVNQNENRESIIKRIPSGIGGMLYNICFIFLPVLLLISFFIFINKAKNVLSFKNNEQRMNC